MKCTLASILFFITALSIPLFPNASPIVLSAGSSDGVSNNLQGAALGFEAYDAGGTALQTDNTGRQDAFLPESDLSFHNDPAIVENVPWTLSSLGQNASPAFIRVDWVRFDIGPDQDLPGMGLDDFELSINALSIPEPGILFLLGLALIALVLVQRHHTKTRKRNPRADA
jgi:hypothetical protein